MDNKKILAWSLVHSLGVTVLAFNDFFTKNLYEENIRRFL